MNKHKRLIKLYFYTVLTSILLLFIGFYIYDPLQLFHKPWGRDTTFSPNMRQQAAGIVNNYHFNSIIIGSSILENTSSKEANEKIGGNFVNLSLSGSSYYERLFIMKYIFQKQSIKKVIYSLDAGSYIHQQKDYPSYPLSLFDYLYDNSIINDLKSYLTYDFLKCLLTFSNSVQCIGHKTSLDRPNAWFNEKGNKVRYGGLSKWFEADNSNKIKDVFRDIVFQTEQIKLGKPLALRDIDSKISNAKYYINRNIINFIKENPKTDFILIFPPYSRIQYALWAQYNMPYFEIHKAIVQYMAKKSEELKNLQVYAFANKEFLDDISNYKDSRHYHVSINSWMLSQIQNNYGLLESKNMHSYLKTITQKAQNYDIITIGKEINNYLKQSKNNTR